MNIIDLWQGYRYFRSVGFSIIKSAKLAYYGEDHEDYWNLVPPNEDNLDHHWLCDCGNYITDGCHCPDCQREPPWGCPCDWCQGGQDYEDDEDEYFGIFDYP